MLASPVNPANPSARARTLRLSVGNGCTREIRPQSVFSWRARRPRHCGSTAWCSYHGSAVTDVQPMPALGEAVDDRTHHHTCGSRVGSEVRAQHQNVHRLFLASNGPVTTIDGATAASAALPAPVPTLRVVAHRQRRGPRGELASHARALSSAPAPGIDGQRFDEYAARRRRLRATRSRRRRSAGSRRAAPRSRASRTLRRSTGRRALAQARGWCRVARVRSDPFARLGRRAAVAR